MLGLRMIRASFIEFFDEVLFGILSGFINTSSTVLTTIYLPPISSLVLKLSLKVA